MMHSLEKSREYGVSEWLKGGGGKKQDERPQSLFVDYISKSSIRGGDNNVRERLFQPPQFNLTKNNAETWLVRKDDAGCPKNVEV